MSNFLNRLNPVSLLFVILCLAAVSCTESEPTSSLSEAEANLIVEIQATGIDIDPSIAVVVNDSLREFITAGRSAEFSGLLPGVYQVEIDDLRLNCTLQGETIKSVNIPEQEPVTLVFEIFCKDALIDEILFVQQVDQKHNLLIMNSTGSDTRLFTENVDPESSPVIFKDGTLVAYTSLQQGNPEVFVQSVDGTLKRNISKHPLTDRNPDWSPDSTLLVFESNRNGNFEIYKVDLELTELTNLTENSFDDFDAIWSPTGGVIAFEREINTNREIFTMDADGNRQFNLSLHPEFDTKPAWSPDGSEIVFVSNRTGNFEIFSIETDGEGLTNFTNHPGFDTNPVWGVFGDRLVFESSRDGDFEIFVMNRGGGGQRGLTDNEKMDITAAWSPAGDKIVFSSVISSGLKEIFVISSEGGIEKNLTGSLDGLKFNPVWSPFQQTDNSDGSDGTNDF